MTAVIFMCVSLFSEASGQALAEQPEEQRKAVKKILELGGDWELPSKTVLIGFIGDNFTNETFALLEPLTDLTHLAFIDIPADDSAFASCRNLANVEWLQISDCSLNGTGLRHLAKCRNLRDIYIDETPFTDEALATLAKFPSIESLVIGNVDIPSGITRAGVLKLSTLKNAKKIYIDMAEDPADLEAEMKVLLPNCEFSLTRSPAHRD